MSTGYVALILEKDNKFLVEKRLKKGTTDMEIVFPGGRVEEGETPEQAIIREAREELNIRIYNLKLVFSDFVHQRDGKKISWFHTNKFSGEIIKKTADELKWISPSKHNLLSYQNSQQALKTCLTANKFSRSD
jgi:mutator protein MutT